MCPRLVMVHLARKKRNGRVYLYLEQRARINGKSRRVWQIYLGREDKIQETGVAISPKKVEYQTMSFGSSAALLQIAQKIGLVEIIDAVAGKRRQQNLSLGEYMLISVINRCVAPKSKSQLGKWFQHDYLATVFPISPEILNAQTYWNHFQRLTEDNIAQIETELARRGLQTYQLRLDCLLFDPTNFYTFIAEHGNSSLPQFGKSKDHRKNLRIVNLSLLCTLQFGVPLFHHTYEGNVQDAKHFKGVLTSFLKRFQTIQQEIEEIVLIFDKGNHSPEVFHQIESVNLPFVASLRPSTQKDLLQIPLADFTTTHLPRTRKEIQYYQLQREVYGIGRTLYVVYDPRQAKKATMAFKAKLQKRLTEIQTFLQKLNVKKWRHKAKVEAKLAKLIGKQPFVDVIRPTVTGSFADLQVTIHVDEVALASYLPTLGRTILFTSQDAWLPEVVIQAFRDKYVIEDAFKHLKHAKFLTIRPMYHWADACIRAHVFTCLLGLLLLSLLRLELHRHSVALSYTRILTELAELQLSQVYTSRTSPPIYKLNRCSTRANTLFQVLKLKKLLPQ